jgi:hypothetical protein
LNTDRISITAWLYLSIAFLTVLDVFVKLGWIAPFTSVLIVLFIVIEFKNIPRYQQAAGAILVMIGLAGAAASGRWDAVVLDAIARSRAFLLLFFAVSWLQIPAGRSPSLLVVRTAILNQPPGRRFLFLSYGIHVLGSILNLAGLSLFSAVVREQKDLNLKRRVAMALIQGFTSASCWSPFYVGMIVVLVAIPTLKWSDVAPSGAMLALTLIMTGWLYDRYAVRQSTLPSQNPAKSKLSALKISQAILIPGLLVASVVAVLELTGVAIPVALGLVSPPFAIIWFALIEFQPHTAIQRGVELTGKVVGGLPSLRNEAMVFVAANILGLGVASAIPAADFSSVIIQIIPWADARIFLLFAIFVVCGFIGIHPVIVILFIGSVLAPEALGLRDWIVGVVYLGCWGLCTMISPFSGTTLFMARETGTPAHVIAWQWASRPTILQAFAIFLVTIAIRHATL